MHLDESCLGNGKPGDNPGGAGGLVEIRTSAGLQRREFYLHSKATTNNRMALASARPGRIRGMDFRLENVLPKRN